MFKDILQSINGVDLFPIIALIVFLIVFTAILFWVRSLDKKTIEEMESLPFDNIQYDGDK